MLDTIQDIAPEVAIAPTASPPPLASSMKKSVSPDTFHAALDGMSRLGWDCSMVGIRLRALSRLMMKTAADAGASPSTDFVEEVYLVVDIMGTLADQLDAIDKQADARSEQYKLEAER